MSVLFKSTTLLYTAKTSKVTSHETKIHIVVLFKRRRNVFLFFCFAIHCSIDIVPGSFFVVWGILH